MNPSPGWSCSSSFWAPSLSGAYSCEGCGGPSRTGHRVTESLNLRRSNEAMTGHEHALGCPSGSSQDCDPYRAREPGCGSGAKGFPKMPVAEVLTSFVEHARSHCHGFMAVHDATSGRGRLCLEKHFPVFCRGSVEHAGQRWI